MSPRPPQPSPRTIVTSGGGGFSAESSPALDDLILEIAAARAKERGRERPNVVFLPTASGDAEHYVLKFYRRFSSPATCQHISLFRRERSQPSFERTLAEADLIYVGGGSVNAMLGAWRELGIDQLLRAAYSEGAVVCGPSAGALCWSEEGLSRFYPWAERYRGLGLLPGSLCVHYTNEPARREEYLQAIGAGEIPAGYGLSDRTAIVWEDEKPVRFVTTKEGAVAARVERDQSGAVSETPLELELIRDEPPALSEIDEYREVRRIRSRARG